MTMGVEKVEWDVTKLHRAPRCWAATDHTAPGVEAVFFEGEPWKGRPTRVFAWMGVPYVPEGQTCPAMILLHGGGGTAFDQWVRLWNQRGYAAICIDQCGCIPPAHGAPEGCEHPRHEHGGPAGWCDSFQHVNEPISDQWPYHAVCAALRAHTLLAAQPEVDADRIGVTGISLGGYLTGLVAGVDARLKCAVPVYGCGCLGENSTWRDEVFPGMPSADVARWLSLWDPAVYLPSSNMPFLWVTGTNDFAYPMDSLQTSYRMPINDRSLCVRVEMAHGHAAGWEPHEIDVFTDSVLRAGAPLARLSDGGSDGRRLWTSFESSRPVMRAEIVYTRATGHWADRKYNVLPAVVDEAEGCVSAEVPSLTTVCFLNVFDDRDCVVSTEHVVFE